MFTIAPITTGSSLPYLRFDKLGRHTYVSSQSAALTYKVVCSPLFEFGHVWYRMKWLKEKCKSFLLIRLATVHYHDRLSVDKYVTILVLAFRDLKRKALVKYNNEKTSATYRKYFVIEK